MDFSKATDYELVKELARRMDENASEVGYNAYPHEYDHDGRKYVTFYVDDGEDCACDVEFTFDDKDKLIDCRNDRNHDVNEEIENFMQDNEGEYCLLELAHRALEAYGVY